MKPKTFNAIKHRLEENLRWMNDDNTNQDEYQLMLSENETMEWISACEGKGKEFTKFYQGVGISIQCEENRL